MEGYIEIEGKKYKLVPLEEEKDESEDILEDYEIPISKPVDNQFREVPKMVESTQIKRAVPKLSGYRERFKKHQLQLRDVVSEPKALPTVKQFDPDPGNSFSRQAGYQVWFGEGTQIDY